MQFRKGLKHVWGCKSNRFKQLPVAHLIVMLHGGNAALWAELGDRACVTHCTVLFFLFFLTERNLRYKIGKLFCSKLTLKTHKKALEKNTFLADMFPVSAISPESQQTVVAIGSMKEIHE